MPQATNRKQKIELKKLHRQIEQIKAETGVVLPGTWTPEDANTFIMLTAELLQRDADALRLYKPLKVADQFHRCMAHEVGLSGSNRAGKTLAAAAEVAMAALGLHYIREKYPKDKVRIACIGSDGRHLSTMYSYLFSPGRMKVFCHPQTFQWVVVIEDDPEHQKYIEHWQESEPLIPERYVKEVAWEDKKEQIPKSVLLHNGTRIRFYSGLVRKVPQGVSWHLVWLDEELMDIRRWLTEARARIADINGRLFWSATPHNATVEFWDMKMKAEDPEVGTLPPSEQTAFFEMLNADNPYISQVGMSALGRKLKDDDEEYQVRFMGKFAKDYMKVYPEFQDNQHVIDPFPLRWGDTRYIVIDPGVDVAGVLFITCLEPWQQNQKYSSDQEVMLRSRDCLVVYDELYIRQASAQIVAAAIKQKLDSQPKAWVQDFTIDKMGGRTIVWKGMQEGENAERLYMQAIEALDIKPRSPGWKYGSREVTFGIEQTKKYLVPDLEDGLPHLFVFRPCKKLIWEFKAWKKKRKPNGEFVGYEDGNNHLLDCMRYATTRELQYVAPPDPQPTRTFTRQDFRRMVETLKTGGTF